MQVPPSLRNVMPGRSASDGPLRKTISSYSGAAYNRASVAPVGLHGERLHQIVVFELREDGTTEYSSMTLRALYNYVVRTITEACRKANEERQRHHKRRAHSHSLSSTSLLAYVNDGGGNDTQQPGSNIGVIHEEAEENNNGDNDGSPGHPSAAPTSPPPPITPSDVPPHLPSLTSSNATPPTSSDTNSNPTPITSNQTDGHDDDAQHQTTTQSVHPLHNHPAQRAVQTAFTPLPPPANGSTHRERLGGYLHPRDMRRLVTPFSSSNEPQLMVRRHVMLLNFDPLRAVVLRDRLLVLVPDGADSILIELERRVRGGIAEMENQVFGTSAHDTAGALVASLASDTASTLKRRKSYEDEFAKENDPGDKEDDGHQTETTTEHTEQSKDEWEDIQNMEWTHLPYELQSVDAVLQTVTSMLLEEARKVHDKAVRAMSELRGDSHSRSTSGIGEHAQERLRMHKDDVNAVEGRVQGFVRAMNDVLDDDEDMTLMNLSRLLTHPERFLQPVSQEILHEESDEPELILEAYLQQALSIVNELDLLKGQILTTEEQISMTLDAMRNRLLYINTLLSVASLCVALGSFVGSVFGMNLTNHLEQDPTAFVQVTVGVVVAMTSLWAMLSCLFYRAANGKGLWLWSQRNFFALTE
ncbi:hypothetical protein ACHAXT_001060 [Thalassiosira profunda]